MPVRPSPNEVARLLQLERDKRRKLRIKQVREQASVVATRIRHAVKDERERQILLLAQQLKMENEEKKEMALHALQDAYSESMKTVGSAHRAAVEKDYEGQEKERWLARCENQQRAEQRHEIALLLQERKRREQLTEDTRHIVARQRALIIEKVRAADIAAMPPPTPDPVLSLQPIRVKPVKLTDQNAFSTTYYHLGPECIAEREGPTRQPSAHEEAVEIEWRMQGEEEERKRSQLEQHEKALLRHRTALHGEVLRHDYDKLLNDLSDLQRTDRERKQKVLHTLPKQMFQPPHRLVEEKLGKQRELEKVFEQMYFLETNYAGDTSLALDPAHEEPSTPVRDAEQPVDALIHSNPGNSHVKFASVQGDVEDADDDTRQPGRLIDHDKTPDTALRTLMGRIRNQRERMQANTDTTSSSFTSEGAGATPAHDSTSSGSNSSTSTLPSVSNGHILFKDQDRSYMSHSNDRQHSSLGPNGSTYYSRQRNGGYEFHAHFHGNANNSARFVKENVNDACDYDDDDALNVTLTPPPSPQLVIHHKVNAAMPMLDTDEYYTFLERQRRELMQMRFGAVNDDNVRLIENQVATRVGSGSYFSSRTELLDLSVDSTTAANRHHIDNDGSTLDVKRGNLFSNDADSDRDDGFDNMCEADFSDSFTKQSFSMKPSGAADNMNRLSASYRLFNMADVEDEDEGNVARVNCSLVSGLPKAQADIDDLETRRSQINDLLTRLSKQRGELEERSRAHEEEMERLQRDWMNELQSVKKAVARSDHRSTDQQSSNSFAASEPRKLKSATLLATSLPINVRSAAEFPDTRIRNENGCSSIADHIHFQRSAWDNYSESKDAGKSAATDAQLMCAIAASPAAGTLSENVVIRRLEDEDDYNDSNPALDGRLGDQSLNMSSFIPSDDGIVITSGDCSRRDDSDIVHTLPPLPGYSAFGVLRPSTGNVKECHEPPRFNQPKPSQSIQAAADLDEKELSQLPPVATISHAATAVVSASVSHLSVDSSEAAAVSMPLTQTTQADKKSSYQVLLQTIHAKESSREAVSPPLQAASTGGAGNYRVPTVAVSVPASQPTMQLSSTSQGQQSFSSEVDSAVGRTLDCSVPTVGVNTSCGTAKIVLTAYNSPATADSSLKQASAIAENIIETSTLHSSTWQNELEQYSLSTSSSKSASSANSFHRSATASSKNVSFDLPCSHDQQQLLATTALSLSTTVSMPSIQAVANAIVLNHLSLDDDHCTPPALSFQPLIPDGTPGLDRWMDYLRRESENDANLAIDNSGGAQWSMPGEWCPSIAAAQQQNLSDKMTKSPTASSAAAANPLMHSNSSRSSSGSSAKHSVDDHVDDVLVMGKALIGDDSSLKSASSLSLGSSTSPIQHTLSDSLPARSDSDKHLIEAPTVDDVIVGALRGITDEPELSFVALSSTMSTPQRQPQFTSSPNIPRDRPYTLSPKHMARNAAIRVDMPTEGVEEDNTAHNSNNQSSSLASFEQHEHSLASAAISSGLDGDHADAYSSTKIAGGFNSCTTSTASWSVVSDSAVMKANDKQQHRSAVNRRPASAGSAAATSKQHLISIPVAQLTTPADNKLGNGTHLSQIISSWKQSRPIRNQGGDGKAATLLAVSKRVDPTNFVEHSSADRKKAEKDMLARTKRLYNQLEEVKVKNRELERKKHYAGNREKVRDYNQKHRETAQRRRSNSRDEKTIQPAVFLPVSVS